MYSWRKIGRVFGPEYGGERTWFREYSQAPASLLLPDVIRMYFSCRPRADESGRYVSYSAYVDLDRGDPTKVVNVAPEPVLQLGARGTFDEFGTYPFSVIRVGDEVRGYYGGWTRCESVPFNVAIGLATSSDGGATFRRVQPGPVLGYAPDEPFVISGPKIRKFGEKFVLFYIAGRRWKLFNGRPEPVYRIRVAFSADGLHWERHGQDLIPCILEEDEAQASPDVFYRDGFFHMYFCFRYSTDFRSGNRGYRLGYARSADLVHWERDDSQCTITTSGEGWDSDALSYPHVFDVDGRMYMAYLGNEVGRNGFGLAVQES